VTNLKTLRAFPALLLLLVMTLLSSTSVFAQEPAPQAGGERNAAGYASLADILENDEARDRLIRELRGCLRRSQ